MSNTASLKKEYQDRIVPALTKEFGYKTVMQVPVLKKIVINQGLGMAAADKKIIDIAISELSAITGQKAVATVSKKYIRHILLHPGVFHPLLSTVHNFLLLQNIFLLAAD